MNKPNMMDSNLPPGGLPQAERDKLEERIIAYFEGSLDSQSSSQLLREVGQSAAKRSLFHSYETLNRVIAAARTPLEAPLEVKRSIVERIPGLLAWIPGLLGTAPAIPVITQSASPFIGFISKIPLSTAISVGTSAVVLTTAGVIVKNKLDDNAAQEARQRVANVRTYEAPQTSTPHTYAPLASRELSSNVGSAAVAVASDAGHTTSSARSTSEHAMKDHSNSASHISTTRNVSSIEHSKSLPNNATSNASSSNAPVANKPVESKPVASNNDQADHSPTFGAVQPLAVSSATSNVHVIVNPASVMMPMPIAIAEGLAYRMFAYAGARTISLNEVNGAKGTTTVSNFAAGVDIPVSQKLAIVAKVGRSAFAHASNEFGPAPSQYGLPIYGKHTELSNNQQYWTTAGLSYQLLKLGEYPVFTSLDLGTVFFGNDVGLMGVAGLATEIPVFAQFSLRPSVTYDMVRSAVVDVQNNLRVPRGAIVLDNKTDATQVWTSALGFGLTFSTRF
jgi:hypothetical protein